jgi:pimeloyl-ACP methyl ester carboxylesterase
LKTLFLHGLESSGHGDKARHLATLGVLTPTFTGTLQERMAQLEPWLCDGGRCVLVGSSFGGLMAALWTVAHVEQVERLILLAPALHRPEFVWERPVPTPTLLIHGRQDEVVPFETVGEIAGKVFSDLTLRAVDDDHRLKRTSEASDWKALLAGEWPERSR